MIPSKLYFVQYNVEQGLGEKKNKKKNKKTKKNKND